jgi:large subunit ribosomal protein L6
MKEDLKEEVKVPEKVQVSIDNGLFKVKGVKGECSRVLKSPKIKIKQEGNTVIFSSPKATRRELKMIFTFMAHLKNMIQGVQAKHYYKLKICSGHFPMNVSLKGKEFSVKNFLGEKVPRVTHIKDNVDVKIEGDHITVESVDVERAGQTAADIESSTRIVNKDLRIFQDGIYITEKDGVPIRR